MTSIRYRPRIDTRAGAIRRTGFLLVLLLPLLVSATGLAQSERITPDGRSGFVLAYDAARDNVLLFGGSGDDGRLGDTWTWTPAGWTHHEVEGPAPRSDAHVAYDAARERVVMFGGRTPDGLSGETWTWDGAGWELAATTGPARRQLGNMAYDEARERIVLFGGRGDDRATFGDTWLWDGEVWTEASPGASPSPRGAHLMAYDGASEQIVLLGGYDGDTRGDLWGWDGRTWTERDAPALPRLHGSLVYDTRAGELLVFGGFGASQRESDVWRWRDGRWHSQETAGGPDVRAEHDGVWLPDLGYVVFGGVTGQGMAVEDRLKANDVWILSANGWTEW